MPPLYRGQCSNSPIKAPARSGQSGQFGGPLSRARSPVWVRAMRDLIDQADDRGPIGSGSTMPSEQRSRCKKPSRRTGTMRCERAEKERSQREIVAEAVEPAVGVGRLSPTSKLSSSLAGSLICNLPLYLSSPSQNLNLRSSSIWLCGAENDLRTWPSQGGTRRRWSVCGTDVRVRRQTATCRQSGLVGASPVAAPVPSPTATPPDRAEGPQSPIPAPLAGREVCRHLYATSTSQHQAGPWQSDRARDLLLRRTYISIALLANEFDVKWVMDQVGHADSAMTMDVYAQLQQRAERQYGANFDRLVRKARVWATKARIAASNESSAAGRTTTERREAGA